MKLVGHVGGGRLWRLGCRGLVNSSGQVRPNRFSCPETIDIMPDQSLFVKIGGATRGIPSFGFRLKDETFQIS